VIEIDPAVEVNFRKVLEDHTAGDPMRSEVKWTNLSRRQIAERMKERGTPVSRDVVSQEPRQNKLPAIFAFLVVSCNSNHRETGPVLYSLRPTAHRSL
jgi:hypothetical protein